MEAEVEVGRSDGQRRRKSKPGKEDLFLPLLYYGLTGPVGSFAVLVTYDDVTR